MAFFQSAGRVLLFIILSRISPEIPPGPLDFFSDLCCPVHSDFLINGEGFA